MSRCCGGNSVTSRAPIRMVPPVTCSSPAIRRSTVDFPLPDGPTSTRSSPSVASRLRSRAATKPFAYTLSTCSSAIRAIRYLRLPFYSASSEPLHDTTLEHKHHRRHGSGGDHCGGEDLTPRHLILPAEQCNRDGDSLPLRPKREREREEELVPAVDEREDGGCRQARHRQRKQYFREALSSRGAIDVSCFLEIARNLTDRAGEYPHGERHRECHVRHDESRIRIDQAK